MTDFAAARANMVESQIRPNKVTDPALIQALATLPREQFVPTERRPLAYVDEDLPIGGGCYLMEPMVLARLIQTAAPARSDIALVVGCGTGYAVAVLSRLCETVIGVEADATLAEKAASTLVNLGIDNVLIVEGNPKAGHARQAPYNVILFDGAVPKFPDALADQCAERGRVVGVIDGPERVGRATVSTRLGGNLSSRTVFDAGIPSLKEFKKEEAFSF